MENSRFSRFSMEFSLPQKKGPFFCKKLWVSGQSKNHKKQKARDLWEGTDFFQKSPDVVGEKIDHFGPFFANFGPIFAHFPRCSGNVKKGPFWGFLDPFLGATKRPFFGP